MTKSTKNETLTHEAAKLMMYHYINVYGFDISRKALEEWLPPQEISSSGRKGGRRIDVSLETKRGQKIAIEIQRSYISVKNLIKRTEAYNKRGIYVLWVLDGKGKCVADEKSNVDKKKVKISSLEKFLHHVYGGRVYYTHLAGKRRKRTIKTPFALNFSIPDKKKYQGKYQDGYKTYYVRRQFACKLKNWKLTCTKSILKSNSTKEKFMIATFQDEVVMQRLKSKILEFAKENPELISKKLVKSIKKRFKKEYGKSLVEKAILRLEKYNLINV